MCGIAGFVNADGRPVDAGLLRGMTDVLAHRGPDGEGFFVRGPVGLGHRRLAIIDLATGDQPMLSEDGALALVFNGEVYNFRELRQDLTARGQRFRTQSDTEVILRAYEAHGPDCVGRLRGMFAFALWDGRAGRLLLARDRVGIKPLVYAWDGRRLAFASEIKSLLQDPALPRRLDWEALRDYLVFHYVPAPATIFQDVRKLPPASCLLFEPGRGEPEIRRYWDLRFEPDERPSEAEWIEGLRAELLDAVRSHMVADVPIGAFLSGGMDSSAVVALMARTGAGRVRTFSIGFDEAGFDELAHARRVARRYDTDHYEFVVKPDALEALPRLAWQLDEPFADASALPTYYVSKITREHVTVALSGDGGDENFAGYRRYPRGQAFHERMDRLPGSLIRPLVGLAARLLPAGARGQGYLDLLGTDPVDRYFKLVTAHDAASLGRLLTGEVLAQVRAGTDPGPFRRLVAEAAPPDYVSAMQYLDIRTYLPDDILAKVDRASMLVSLEARVPLLDHRLMEYVARIPSRLKLSAGRGKVIFKKAMAPDLPPQVLQRAKMGFGVPLGSWFRRDLADYVRDTLLGSRARARGIFEPRAVASLLAEHAAGPRDRSARIWALLMFEEWARRWLDG